jgi:hypothetical protein
MNKKSDVAAGDGEGAAALELREHARHPSAVGREGHQRDDGGRDAQLAEAEAQQGEVACGEGEVEGVGEGCHGFEFGGCRVEILGGC